MMVLTERKKIMSELSTTDFTIAASPEEPTILDISNIPGITRIMPMPQ